MRRSSQNSFLSGIFNGVKGVFDVLFSVLGGALTVVIKLIAYTWGILLLTILILSLSFWLITVGIRNLDISFDMPDFIKEILQNSDIELGVDWQQKIEEDKTIGKFLNELEGIKSDTQELRYKAGEVPSFIEEEFKKAAEKAEEIKETGLEIAD